MDYDSSQQTISWFWQRARDQTLTLNPPFQRRPVWSRRQQSHLIESVLMSLPIPEIYLQQKTSPQGTTEHAVVDGQQRITAILAFIGDGEEGGFDLEQLSLESSWRDMSLSDLTDDQRSAFFGHRLTVRMLNNASDDEVKDLFRRLNKYLTKLSPQELRNATYSGPLMRLSEALAEDPYWAENRIVSPQGIRRMGDIEFVSELLIGVAAGPQGGSEASINEYFRQYEEYEDEFPDQGSAKRRFDRTLDLVQELFPDIKLSRWRNKSDFYSLFLALAHLRRTGTIDEERQPEARAALDAFAAEIVARGASDAAKVSDVAARYVRNVQRGANDKSRRAARHQAVIEVVQPYFRKAGAPKSPTAETT